MFIHPRLSCICLVLLLWATAAPAQYGSIKGMPIAKPDDVLDAKAASPPADAVVLFDGTSLDNWTKRDSNDKSGWKLLRAGIGEVHGGDVMTKQQFSGHFKLHVEFRVPYLPNAKGQARGNSGVYVQGRYEVQVLDSYGLNSKDNDCGAIYEVAAPLVNACKAPTIWQSYDIDFHSPNCENGKQIAPPVITVHQNGILIQDHTKITKTNTRAGRGGDPCTPGPIMLQDHGSPVQYRNIWLVQLDQKPSAPKSADRPPMVNEVGPVGGVVPGCRCGDAERVIDGGGKVFRGLRIGGRKCTVLVR
jgi:hypothetical protein